MSNANSMEFEVTGSHDPYLYARDDEAVMEWHHPDDPIGVWIRPGDAGWLTAMGLDVKDWLTNPPPSDLDTSRFIEPKFSIKDRQGS